MIARCPKCNSIWVCWNWYHCDLDRLVEFNPHLTRDELKNGQWGHECWGCDNVHETENKATNGIPYWILRHFSKYFTKGRG